ncbi:MAG: hypothetical protein KGS48_05385 [Bacteroidetes bacterium]|nr:hypothetical protein [Bacteroidota bacterium]
MPQRQFKSLFTFTLLFATTFCCKVGAQSCTAQLGSPSYHIIDRLTVKTGENGSLHTAIKGFPKQDIAELAWRLDTLRDAPLSLGDRIDIRYLQSDNNAWAPDAPAPPEKHRKSLWRYFYPSPANLFEINVPDFTMRVNPMFNLGLGRQKNDDSWLFENQRGLEVYGSVDKRVFFYTNLVESQARYPNYITKWYADYQSLPGAGFVKSYKPRFSTIQNGYDFNVATAYLSVKVSKHVAVQLGHGRHFIGNGYRSLLLSDVGAPNLYLKLNTRVWRFQYQNLFMELTPNVRPAGSGGDVRLPKKYAAMHFLQYQITPNMGIGLFEAVIFNRSRQFEFQYLNPLIFYRTVEGMIGSPDNVLIGLDGHWNLFKRIQLYGQVLLDEFKASNLIDPVQKGWWANKYGIQLGLKYFDVLGIDHLDLQLEWNRVRPYTYSHFDSLNSYTHYNQPLAHPLWANFNEFIGLLQYRPVPKLTLYARWMHALRGDNDQSNWGANPLISYKSFVREYGNVVGQGIRGQIDLLGLDASFMIMHNTFLDLGVLLRRKNSAANKLDLDTRVLKMAIRMNIWNPNRDF